ncbi:protein unc-79-like protein [Caerostris extrusa]|uniref:Protein unc-79-like protein n=1 Tax=Caerostris extrusa TaxID=172846 RepID=A0AAV4Q3H8_CAEEX|nr:protein unc-79-like protein [Caerostris extrusa]
MPYKRAMSAPGPLIFRQDKNWWTTKRYSARRDSFLECTFYRAMDVDDHDKETLPLLIFLLMQFLSRPDPIHRCDDKITRSQYHYDNYPINRYVQWLVLIVLNTLKAQHHRCKQVHEPLLSPLPSRSRGKELSEE